MMMSIFVLLILFLLLTDPTISGAFWDFVSVRSFVLFQNSCLRSSRAPPVLFIPHALSLSPLSCSLILLHLYDFSLGQSSIMACFLHPINREHPCWSLVLSGVSTFVSTPSLSLSSLLPLSSFPFSHHYSALEISPPPPLANSKTPRTRRFPPHQSKVFVNSLFYLRKHARLAIMIGKQQSDTG